MGSRRSRLRAEQISGALAQGKLAEAAALAGDLRAAPEHAELDFARLETLVALGKAAARRTRAQHPEGAIQHPPIKLIRHTVLRISVVRDIREREADLDSQSTDRAHQLKMRTGQRVRHSFASGNRDPVGEDCP